MTKQDLSTFIKGRYAMPPIDFKEIERIHREGERYDLDRARRYWEDRDMAGRYKVVPNDPKGPMLKFEHGCTITMRSSRESVDE